jgi:hypothetical protein
MLDGYVVFVLLDFVLQIHARLEKPSRVIEFTPDLLDETGQGCAAASGRVKQSHRNPLLVGQIGVVGLDKRRGSVFQINAGIGANQRPPRTCRPWLAMAWTSFFSRASIRPAAAVSDAMTCATGSRAATGM